MFWLTWVAYDQNRNPMIQYFTYTQSEALLKLRGRVYAGELGGKDDGLI